MACDEEPDLDHVLKTEHTTEETLITDITA